MGVQKRLLIGLFFLLTGGIISSCSLLFKKDAKDKVIAVTAGKELTYSQLKMAIPSSMKEIDSISFAQNYIEKWVKNQLMLEKAELNLDKPTLKSIETMIDNYRTSLLVFKYQQMLIMEKLDTVVTPNQIKEYYSQNVTNFKLDFNVVKAIYVKLQKGVSDSYKAKQWMKSNKEADLMSLEDFCYQNATNFNMGDQWIDFSQLLRSFPKSIPNQESFLKYNKFIETQDSLYTYFITIRDYKLVGDTTPIMFVENNIRDILLNRRKIQFINDLENNIYRDAVNQKKFTIYAN